MLRLRDRYRTQFCFIGPGSMLNRYATASHTHLVLPHVLNADYLEFYTRKRKEGDILIMDNGVYEGAFDHPQFMEAVDYFRPQIAVLPDALMEDGEKTFEMAHAFLQSYAHYFPATKWMYVPQSTPGDLHGYMRWMNKFLKEHKEVRWVGIPRALATDIAKGPNAKWARVDLVEELTMRGYQTHALGMANGDLEELDRLAWEGVCSCDSSCAIWRGHFEKRIGYSVDEAWWNEHGTPVDFDAKHTPKFIEGVDYNDRSIMLNINYILRACGREPFND